MSHLELFVVVEEKVLETGSLGWLRSLDLGQDSLLVRLLYNTRLCIIIIIIVDRPHIINHHERWLLSLRQLLHLRRPLLLALHVLFHIVTAQTSWLLLRVHCVEFVHYSIASVWLAAIQFVFSIFHDRERSQLLALDVIQIIVQLGRRAIEDDLQVLALLELSILFLKLMQLSQVRLVAEDRRQVLPLHVGLSLLFLGPRRARLHPVLLAQDGLARLVVFEALLQLLDFLQHLLFLVRHIFILNYLYLLEIVHFEEILVLLKACLLIGYG